MRAKPRCRTWPIWLLVLAAPLSSGVAQSFSECESHLVENPRDWQSADCFYQTARRHNQWEEAQRRLRAHRERDPDNAWLPFYLGRMFLDRDQAEAEEWLSLAAAGFAAQGESLGETYSRINLSRFYRSKGRMADAKIELGRGSRAAETSGDPALLAQVEVQTARLMMQGGQDLASVYRQLQRVEALAFPQGPYTLRRDALLQMGGVAFELGRYGAAQSHYQRLVTLAQQTENLYDEATARLNLTRTILAQTPHPGLRQEVQQLARRALRAAVATGNRQVEARARLDLGKLLDGPSGALQIKRSLEIARQIEDPSATREALEDLAMRELERDPQAAQRLVDEATAVAMASEDPWSLAYGWSQRARVRWATAPQAQALADSLATVDLIERLRQLQDLSGGRAELFSVWIEVYQWLAGRILVSAEAPGREECDLAFELSERLRARVLLDTLGAARTVPALEPEHPLMRARLDTQGAMVQVNRRLLTPGLAAGERATLVDELEGLELEAAELAHQISRDHPAFAPVDTPRFATLRDIETELGDEEALLSFQVALWRDVYGAFGGGAWLMVSARDTTRVYRLPGRAELEAKVPMALGLIARRDGTEQAAMRRLYADLLEEAVADLPPHIERLVLVPDGVLHLLPFGALSPAAGTPPLASRYVLSVVPSATLWLRWRKSERTPATSTALAMVDPVLAGAQTSRGSLDRAWALTVGGGPGPLPHARREGRSVLRRLGPTSRLRSGEAASERFLKETELGEYEILHFAAHAMIDDENPQRSAVLLAAGGEGEDGLLQPAEIAELDFEGRVVVLSACESAGGNLLRGEGVMSLARSFFQAGAHAVVGSLWPLGDRDAADFFELFYRHLARGKSLDAALAAAQGERMRDGAPAAAWAGLVVLGNGELVPQPGGHRARNQPWSLLWGSLAGAAFLAAIVFVLLRHIRARKRSLTLTAR